MGAAVMKRPDIHPACAMLPELPPKAYADLCASIAACGLQQPILLLNGQVIDGKNRLRACEQTKVVPRFETADLHGVSPVAFVLSLNRARLRNKSQLALAAAGMVTASHGGDRKSDEIKSYPVGVDFTRDDAAREFGISKGAIDQARFVLDHGVPELLAYVECGELALRAAWDVAHAPEDQQTDACAVNVAAVRTLAREMRDTESGPSVMTAMSELSRFEAVIDALEPPTRVGVLESTLASLHRQLDRAKQEAA